MGTYETPAGRRGLENSAGSSTAYRLVTTCIEIDLRLEYYLDPAALDQLSTLRLAVDGLAPGDVVKLQVNRHSRCYPTLFEAIPQGCRVQITADNVLTAQTWAEALRGEI